MSEMQSEYQPQSSGNVFTRKIGPLPMWAWMAITLVLAIGFYLYNKKKNANANASSGSPSGAPNTPGGVDASLVPQFVNQVYNQEQPPPAPNVTVNNTIPTQAGPTNNPPTTQPPPPPSGGPQSPKPPATRPGTFTPEKVTYTKYTVHPGDTLQSLSRRFGVSEADIAHAPGNVYVKGEVPGDKKVGQQLGTGAGLKTGQVLNIPHFG